MTEFIVQWLILPLAALSMLLVVAILVVSLKTLRTRDRDMSDAAMYRKTVRERSDVEWERKVARWEKEDPEGYARSREGD